MAPSPLDPSSIDAVVFDIGGVFLIPHPAPVIEWHKANRLPITADDDRYRRAHHRAVRRIYDAGVSGMEGDPATWDTYDMGYYEELGVEPPGENLRRWDWRLVDNIEAFIRISTGVRPVAVVSNNDGTASQQLVDHGIGQVGPGPLTELVSVTDSGAIGVAKPDPAIFEPVLDALDLAPNRVLYVGDTVQADVLGARAANLQIVQLDPYDDHADFDHPRLPNLAALETVLA